MSTRPDSCPYVCPEMVIRAAVFCSLLPVLLVSTATAGEKVGRASHVRNKVLGKIQIEAAPINQDDDVFSREVVKTFDDSLAKIILKDDTNLSVGPNSSVTLDKFVYSGPSDFTRATINLAKGSFRFSSGRSDKRSYEIRTPNATIGVRG